MKVPFALYQPIILVFLFWYNLPLGALLKCTSYLLACVADGLLSVPLKKRAANLSQFYSALRATFHALYVYLQLIK